jgi:hypothetical protein
MNRRLYGLFPWVNYASSAFNSGGGFGGRYIDFGEKQLAVNACGFFGVAIAGVALNGMAIGGSIGGSGNHASDPGVAATDRFSRAAHRTPTVSESAWVAIERLPAAPQ